MKKIILILLTGMTLWACNTSKLAQADINKGDYERAFDRIIKKLQKGISQERKEKYLPLFQKSYLNLVEKKENQIQRWKSENNPAYLKNIYHSLIDLNQIQQQIDPLLPLYYKGKKMSFPQKDYSQAISLVKSDYVAYLYTQGIEKINLNQKTEARQAYTIFKKVNQLSPNYKNVNQLMQQAHQLGINFVLVELNNQTQQIIPRALEKELKDINTYDLDNFWTVFDAAETPNTNYDYLVALNLKEIVVSPERQNLIVHNQEKRIVDGWEYLYQNGQQVVDSLGNPIKVDRYITVRSQVREYTREKDAAVVGEIQILDLERNRRIDRETLDSQFAFRERYIEFDGDRRAMEHQFVELIPHRPLPFPSDEQMVYDCGEDIKTQLKRLLKKTFEAKN